MTWLVRQARDLSLSLVVTGCLDDEEEEEV